MIAIKEKSDDIADYLPQRRRLYSLQEPFCTVALPMTVAGLVYILAGHANSRLRIRLAASSSD